MTEPLPSRCSFASCRRPGEFFEPEDRWSFCGDHYRIHLALRREELAHQQAQKQKRPVGRPALRPCGTHAAYIRHKSRGEYPCVACAEAEREYQAARWANRKQAS